MLMLALILDSYQFIFFIGGT